MRMYEQSLPGRFDILPQYNICKNQICCYNKLVLQQKTETWISVCNLQHLNIL